MNKDIREELMDWDRAVIVKNMLIEGIQDEYGNDLPDAWYDVLVRLPGEEGE